MAKSKFRTALEEAMEFAKQKVGGFTQAAKQVLTPDSRSSFQENFKRGYDNFVQQQQQNQRATQQNVQDFTNRLVNNVRSEAPGAIDRTLSTVAPQTYKIGKNIAQAFKHGYETGGIDRVKNLVKNDPGSLWIGRGFASAPEDAKVAVPYLASKVGINISDQTAEDIGYGVRGAANLTGMNWLNEKGLAGEKTKQISQANAPKTERQKRAEDIGQAIYGTALTAPLGGSNMLANIGSRALQGTTLGLAMTTTGKLLTEGRLPTAEELTEGGINGLENSWQLAFTNAATDKLLGKFGWGKPLTDKSIDQTYKLLANASKMGLSKDVMKQLFAKGAKSLFLRSLAEVPAENTLWTFIDQLDGDAKESFVNEWMNNLPGNILGNVAFGMLSAGGRGAFNFNKAEIDSAIETARKLATKAMKDQRGFVDVGVLTGQGQKPGEITVPENLPPKEAKEAIADQIEQSAKASNAEVVSAQKALDSGNTARLEELSTKYPEDQRITPLKEMAQPDPISSIQSDMAKAVDEQKLTELLPKEDVVDPQKVLADEVQADIENKVFQEEIAQAPKDSGEKPKSILQRLNDDFIKGREQRQKDWDVPTLIGRLKTAWSDKFYYAQKHDPELYLNMRLFGGGGDSRTTAIINRNLGGIIKQEADAGRAEDFSNLLALDRLQELTDRGFTRHLDANEIKQGFAELQAKYTPEELGQMRENAQQLRGFLAKLLDTSEQVGLISKESADAARQNNELYVTIETLGQMERDFQKQNWLSPQSQRTGKSFNVSKQEILKKIGDSTTGIVDPVESSLQYIVTAINNIERNAILKDFVERRGSVFGEVDAKTGENAVAIPLRMAENVRERIKINSEIAELTPIKNKIERMLRTRGKWAQQLETKINELNVSGLKEALAKVKTEPEDSVRYQPTNQTVKSGKQAFVEISTPPSTKKMIENLIELPSSDLKRIFKKIDTSEGKLKTLTEEITKMSDELNGVKDDIIELRKARGEISDIENPPEGYGTINVFRDGIKEEWAVPKELEVAIKNLDARPAGTIVELYNKWINQPFKQAVTSKNPVFALLVNPIKDVQNALFAESTEEGAKEAAGLVTNYIGAMGDAFGLSKQRDNWLLAGGGQSGFIGSEIKVDPTKALDQLKKTGGAENRFTDVITKPLDLLEYTSRSMEESTRLSKFNKDFKKLPKEIQGVVADPYIPLAQLPRELREIALDARNITQDFSRMGTAAQQVNKVVSFFNVSLQGTLRLGSMAKDNPKRFIASALVLNAIPALAAVANNMQFQDYSDLRDYERKGNLIWIYKDRTEEEREEGKPLHAFKVPLGQWGAPFYNIAEEVFRFASQEEPGKISELAKTLLGTSGNALMDMSPVSDASNFIPLPAKIATQLKANTDFYSGMPIEPDYIDTDNDGVGDTPKEELPASRITGYYTGPTTELLGRITGPLAGISPAQLDSIINSATGGSGKTVLNVTDTLLGDGPETQNNAILKRFLAPRGGQEAADERALEEEELKQIQDETYGKGINFKDLTFASGASASEEMPIDNTELPKDTTDLKVLYDQAQKTVDGYHEKRLKLEYDPSYKSEIKRKKDIKALEAEYEQAQARVDTIEQERPEQVFEIEMLLHGEDHPDYIKVEDRGDWAYDQLAKAKTAEEFEDMVNKLWENGVLTGRSNGVAAYIKEVYGVDVSRYTGDDAATSKKVGSSSSGSGKKIPKLNVSAPAISTPKINLNTSIGSGISGLFPVTPEQIGYKKVNLKIPKAEQISLPSRKKISANITPMRTRISGL